MVGETRPYENLGTHDRLFSSYQNPIVRCFDCNYNCASVKIICNAPGFTAVPYAAARVQTSSKIENNSST